MEAKQNSCRYVQDLERFFNSEFSTEQLVSAVEEMNVFAEEQAVQFLHYSDLEPKTVALGVLAGYKIRELYDDSYFHKDVAVTNYYTKENMRNQAYQIGMEIVKGKYDNIEEAFSAYEKSL